MWDFDGLRQVLHIHNKNWMLTELKILLKKNHSKVRRRMLLTIAWSTKCRYIWHSEVQYSEISNINEVVQLPLSR